MRRPLVLAALLAASCAAPPPAPPPAAPEAPSAAVSASAPAAAPAPPGLRLPKTVAPVRYRATLTVVPGEPVLEGEIEIDLTLAEPTRLIWLNARELEVAQIDFEAAGTGGAGGRKIAARAIPGGEHHLGVALDAEAPAGAARLRIAYRGRVSSKDDRGVFFEEEGGGKYVFTQFESIDARRGFPCFDEPSFKVPWQLSLRVPKDQVALSNTPIVSEEPVGGAMKLVRFAETKPLPSYLVAFTVGPWEMVPAGRAGKNRTEVRIAVPKGRAKEARWAKEATGALLGELEEQLGIPYPYEKLDVVPIPRTVSFGAMEHPGLVTFFMTGTLAREDEETPGFKRTFGRIMAHELAHQWFGNLVTTAFWDDIWLNEAFAEWMAGRVVARWQPGWDEAIEQGLGAAWAMRQDALVSARKIRQEITATDDIQNAFDGITYEKGAAVLAMFESFVGPERFMQAIRRYLGQHAHRAATSADFLAALGAEAGKEAPEAMASFLDQPGVPLVRVERVCEGGPPRLALRQERLLPVGSPGAAPQAWQVPVCFRTGGGGAAEARACTLLSQASAEVPLGSSARCPGWVMLQAGGAGYYHAAYGQDLLRALLGKGAAKLPLIERVTVLRDVAALADAGKIPVGDALALVPELAKDADPQILKGAMQIAAGVPATHLDEALRRAYARFVREAFGARARQLGLRPKAGEDERIRLLRPELMRLVAFRGEDPAIIAEARKLAGRWLDDPASLESEAVEAVLPIAARYGDRALFDRLRAAARQEKDQKRRSQLVDAMAELVDPALSREAMSLVLSDELDVRDTAWLLYPRDPRTTPVAIGLVKERFDALLARLPGEVQGHLPRVGGGLCDAVGRADLEAFFRDRIGRLDGGPRALAQTLEEISLCIALREARAPGLAAFLKGYAARR